MDNPGGIGNIQPMTTPTLSPQSTTPVSNGNQRCACGCQLHGQGQEPSIWTRLRSLVWNGNNNGNDGLGTEAQAVPVPPAVAAVEKELKCGICLEVMIQAIGLECGHHFCELCILTWLKSELTCPLCLAKARKTLKAIQINNLIDQAYGAAPQEIQTVRKALVMEREQAHRDVDIGELAKEVKFYQSRIPLTPPTTPRVGASVAAAQPAPQATSTATAVPNARVRPLNPATVQRIVRQHSRNPALVPVRLQRFAIRTAPTPQIAAPASVPSTAAQSTILSSNGNRRSTRIPRTPATARPSATPTTTSGARRRSGNTSTPTTGSPTVRNTSRPTTNTTGRRRPISRGTPAPARR